jgi:hypothetical protein
MAEDEGLSLREAVDWCGSGVTVREITRFCGSMTVIRAVKTGPLDERQAGRLGAALHDSTTVPEFESKLMGRAEVTFVVDARRRPRSCPGTHTAGRVAHRPRCRATR